MYTAFGIARGIYPARSISYAISNIPRSLVPGECYHAISTPDTTVYTVLEYAVLYGAAGTGSDRSRL
jgi:hypothetical protein